MFCHKLLLNLVNSWVVPTDFGYGHLKGNINLWGICKAANDNSIQINYIFPVRNQEAFMDSHLN